MCQLELVNGRETKAPAVRRWCYRCLDCLSVVFAAEELDSAECGACGGRVECMGQVARDRLIKAGEECACDFRCTSALGPRCVCKCGGVNHGTGAMVFVVRDCGPVPVVKVPDTAKARRMAAQWRAALAAVLQLWRGLSDRRARGEYLGASDFGRMCALQSAMNRARGSRSQSARLRLLERAIKSAGLDPAAMAPAAFVGQVQAGLFN